MSDFHLKFDTSSAEEEEEEDEYWGKSGKSNKFKKAIFTDSDSEESKTDKIPQINPQASETSAKQTNKPNTESISSIFLAANPVSNRALSRGKV